ncbi:MAG: acetyl-lysine aminotransferase [Caldivirga sp. MG_3]|jgi:acetylornithine aminotransferase apoenzyme (EC 2.6.1.11)/N2-acetyl-L-lysine aminotransferase apoenzyme (EC 2.6.1.-)|nr:MAG: acetyl-lysine aminotransferase [Caldivirga sp. MG_3]
MAKLARYYRVYPINIVRGRMQYVWDSNGNRYLDANTGHGVAFMGHSNPEIINAIKAQLDKIITVPLNMGNEARDEFISEFSRIIPRFDVVFPQNTGTEAVETAIKIGKKWTRRKTIVAFTNSFHGRTMGSLSITWNENYRKAFQPLYPHVKFGVFNNAHEVDKLVDEDTCCVVVEPVQGEGGLNVATVDFLKALREAANRVNALLIFDEIQCGFGRTGYTWAFQHYGVEPDVFTAGKAIAGGLPIGLVVAKGELGDVFNPGEHGSTFAGNPVVMAAAAATVKVFMRDNVPSVVKETGSLLAKRLGELNSRVVNRVKGMGLMIGVELRTRAEPYVEALMKHGVLALTASVNVVRFLPPYMISHDDVDLIVNSLSEVLKGA